MTSPKVASFPEAHITAAFALFVFQKMVVTFISLLRISCMQLQFKRLHITTKKHPKKEKTSPEPLPLPHIFKSKVWQKSKFKVLVGWFIEIF